MSKLRVYAFAISLDGFGAGLPLDVGHVPTYFVAHEAHHRGQL